MRCGVLEHSVSAFLIVLTLVPLLTCLSPASSQLHATAAVCGAQRQMQFLLLAPTLQFHLPAPTSWLHNSMTSLNFVLAQPQDKAAADAAERAKKEVADAAVARRLHELQLADAETHPGLLLPSPAASPEDLAAIAAMEAASQAPSAVSGAHALFRNEQSMQSSLVQHVCLACKLRERCCGKRLFSAAFAG